MQPFRQKEMASSNDHPIESVRESAPEIETPEKQRPRRKTVDTSIPDKLEFEDIDLSGFQVEQNGTTAVSCTFEELDLFTQAHVYVKRLKLWNRPSRSDLIRAAALYAILHHFSKVIEFLANMEITTGLRLKRKRDERSARGRREKEENNN